MPWVLHCISRDFKYVLKRLQSSFHQHLQYQLSQVERNCDCVSPSHVAIHNPPPVYDMHVSYQKEQEDSLHVRNFIKYFQEFIWFCHELKKSMFCLVAFSIEMLSFNDDEYSAQIWCSLQNSSSVVFSLEAVCFINFNRFVSTESNIFPFPLFKFPQSLSQELASEFIVDAKFSIIKKL